MKRLLAALIIALAALLSVGCLSVNPAEDVLYIPNLYAESGSGSVVAATFDPSAKSFSGVEPLSTAAFYVGEKDTTMKKVGTNDVLDMICTQKETIAKFKPNTEDILLIKTAFQPGYDVTAFFSLLFYTDWFEVAQPNVYTKDLSFDIDKTTGDYIDSDYVLAAINRGNSIVKDLYIIDALPAPVEFISSSYSTDDLFIPINVNLAKVSRVEQKTVAQGDKRILVFHVVPAEQGIKPGDMVQIVVKARIKKDALMQPQYSAGH